MIGLTPGATSNALDSLRLLELASDPAKLREAVQSMQDEQAKIQEQIEALRLHTQANQKAAENAVAAAEHAAEAQAEAERKIKQAEELMDAAASAELSVKGQREQLQRDIAQLAQDRESTKNAVANAQAEADAAKAEAARMKQAAVSALEAAVAREEAAKAKEKDLHDRLQAMRAVLEADLKS